VHIEGFWDANISPKLIRISALMVYLRLTGFCNLFLSCILTFFVYSIFLNKNKDMHTKIDIAFLSQVVWEGKSGMQILPHQQTFSSPLFLETKINLFEKITQSFDFGPYKRFVIDTNLLKQYDWDFAVLVKSICFDKPTFPLIKQRWEEYGYPTELFESFYALALYKKYIIDHR